MKETKIINEIDMPGTQDRPGLITFIWKWRDGRGRIRRRATPALKELIKVFFNEN